LKLEPTIDSAAARQWLEVFSSLGVDRTALLAVLDCEESLIAQRDSRLAQRCHNEMLQFGSQSCGIPGIALLAGVKTNPDNLGPSGFLPMLVVQTGSVLFGAGLICMGLTIIRNRQAKGINKDAR